MAIHVHGVNSKAKRGIGGPGIQLAYLPWQLRPPHVDSHIKRFCTGTDFRNKNTIPQTATLDLAATPESIRSRIQNCRA